MNSAPLPRSKALSLALLSENERRAILEPLTPGQLTALRYDWNFWARPNQLPPAGDWTYWLNLGGRGSGKTRTGAEFAIRKAWENPNTHGALIAPTADDARKVMLSAGLESADGSSGILAISPPWFRPRYEPSLRRVTWPNGTIATLYSAEEPNRLRGPQHHWGWVDEIAAWAREADAWDQFLFGLRLGANPQACISTTPRPIPIVRGLVKDPHCRITRGSTYTNRGNLSPKFFETIIKKYEGTRLGRQELLGEILDDVEGALWTHALIEKHRVAGAPTLVRIVVAIDPAVSSRPDSDLTGIVVIGLGVDGHLYVLDDASGKYTPFEWATVATNKFNQWKADRIVAEVNNGGDLVVANLRGVCPNAPYQAVHASRGKQTRAEPVAALYEQGRCHHVIGDDPGRLDLLEDEMCSWAPATAKKSPDRMDALVWGASALVLSDPEPGVVTYEERVRISRY